MSKREKEIAKDRYELGYKRGRLDMMEEWQKSLAKREKELTKLSDELIKKNINNHL